MQISDLLRASCIVFMFVLNSASSHTDESTKSQIIEIKSITELPSAINLSEVSNTIALFDCDGVLFNNRDPALQPGNLSSIIHSVSSDGTLIDASALAQITRSASKELLEPETPEYIKYLREKHIPLFVFTQCSSDKEVRDERFSKLSNLGMDFSSTLKVIYHEFHVSEENLQIRDFQTHTTQPVFDSGILYCGSANKGLVLTEFLNWVLSPEVSLLSCSLSDLNILFIDDAMKNLQDVKLACEKLKIKSFTGVHYTAIENVHKQINPEIAIYQVEHYKENKTWKSDYAARLELALSLRCFKSGYPELDN